MVIGNGEMHAKIFLLSAWYFLILLIYKTFEQMAKKRILGTCFPVFADPVVHHVVHHIYNNNVGRELRHKEIFQRTTVSKSTGGKHDGMQNGNGRKRSSPSLWTGSSSSSVTCTNRRLTQMYWGKQAIYSVGHGDVYVKPSQPPMSSNSLGWLHANPFAWMCEYLWH